MWIKSLYDDVWVNMKHITHFSIESDEPERRGNNLVYAYLDTTRKRWNPNTLDQWDPDQARLLVCQGSKEKCVEFIDKQQFYEGLFQWVGYFVAGGIGAILTLIFQNARP